MRHARGSAALFAATIRRFDQEGNEGGKGRTIPRTLNHYWGAEWLRGRRKVSTMSQVLSSIQYICFPKTSNSNVKPSSLLFAPGAILPRYAPRLDACQDPKILRLRRAEIPSHDLLCAFDDRTTEVKARTTAALSRSEVLNSSVDFLVAFWCKTLFF